MQLGYSYLAAISYENIRMEAMKDPISVGTFNHGLGLYQNVLPNTDSPLPKWSQAKF